MSVLKQFNSRTQPMQNGHESNCSKHARYMWLFNKIYDVTTSILSGFFTCSVNKANVKTSEMVSTK